MSEAQIKQFLNSAYGGAGPGGEVGFSHREGPLYERLSGLGRAGVMGKEMLEFYGGDFGRNGIGGSGKTSLCTCVVVVGRLLMGGGGW